MAAHRVGGSWRWKSRVQEFMAALDPPAELSVGAFTLLALSSLFVIVDPLACVPGFLAMTEGNSEANRRRMARTASVVTGLLLTVFALLGKWVFRFLGIT